jgi:hypothetical protein
MYIGTLLSYRPTLLRVCRISVPFAHSRLRLRRAHTWEKMETLRFGHTLNEGGTASYRPRFATGHSFLVKGKNALTCPNNSLSERSLITRDVVIWQHSPSESAGAPRA